MPTDDFTKRLEDTSENIQASDDIHDRNKELIRDYKRDQVLNGLSEATLLKNITRLKVLAEHVDKPFDEMDKDDVKELVTWVHSRDYTDETIDTYKNVIKVFWKWMKPSDDGEAPPETSWIELSNSNGNRKLPKDLLTKEDIQKQIEAAKNPRDKALISLLYETGARIGEIIDLTVGDIEDRQHGKKVVIDGKTGARRLPLVESVPHINNWLAKHPNPTKEAPLWCKIQQGGPTEHLNPHDVEDIREVHGIGRSYAEKLNDAGIEDGTDLVSHDIDEVADIVGVRKATVAKWFKQFDSDASLNTDSKLGYRYIRDKILKATMERAGIDKPSNPHHYRHSRASYLANELKEAQLCAWMGWVQGSDVPARYVHLSGRDIDNAYDQMHGIVEEDEDEDTPDVIKCPRCDELNEPTAAFCMRCGFALDQEGDDFEAEVSESVTESYKQADPSDDELMTAIDTLNEKLENLDPEMKQALLESMSQ